MESRLRRLSRLGRFVRSPVAPLWSVDGPAGQRANRLNRSVHESYMATALALARRALGRTSPNPAVGALIVKGGRVIATGYHRYAGAPHAEVEALRRAGASARGSTLYVTLEPCAHSGRTPPCCKAILAAGVSRVLIADRDPNPITSGRGIAWLRRGGVGVRVGILAQEAREMNAPFYKAMRAGLPFVTAKVAQSVDGKIATTTGQSRWISSSAARALAHQWRSRTDAILVGIRTVLQDDPRLTVRGAPQRSGGPVKVIVDTHLRTPLSARCLSLRSSARCLIATTVGKGAKRAALIRRGAEVLTFPPRRGRVPLRRLCQALARRGIQSVLVEGGGEVLAGLLEERLVDRIHVFVAPLLIGGRKAPGAIGGKGIGRLSSAIRLKEVGYRRVGSDLWMEACPAYP